MLTISGVDWRSTDWMERVIFTYPLTSFRRQAAAPSIFARDFSLRATGYCGGRDASCPESGRIIPTFNSNWLRRKRSDSFPVPSPGRITTSQGEFEGPRSQVRRCPSRHVWSSPSHGLGQTVIQPSSSMPSSIRQRSPVAPCPDSTFDPHSPHESRTCPPFVRSFSQLSLICRCEVDATGQVKGIRRFGLLMATRPLVKRSARSGPAAYRSGTRASPSGVTEAEREEQYRALLALASDAAYSYRINGDRSTELEWVIDDRLLGRPGPRRPADSRCSPTRTICRQSRGAFRGCCPTCMVPAAAPMPGRTCRSGSQIERF